MYDIPMAQLNVTIPPALRSWVDHRVAEGRYTSASDLVRDLLRKDQESAEEEAEWLRGLIAEGLASGRLNQRPEDVLREIMAEYPARNG
jgi:antitoxin ParD1/3/4